MSPRVWIVAAVGVLFAGVITLVFWLSPHTHTPSPAQITPLAEVVAKNHAAFSAAAKDIPLAKLMSSYFQKLWTAATA